MEPDILWLCAHLQVRARHRFPRDLDAFALVIDADNSYIYLSCFIQESQINYTEAETAVRVSGM